MLVRKYTCPDCYNDFIDYDNLAEKFETYECPDCGTDVCFDDCEPVIDVNYNKDELDELEGKVLTCKMCGEKYNHKEIIKKYGEYLWTSAYCSNNCYSKQVANENQSRIWVMPEWMEKYIYVFAPYTKELVEEYANSKDVVQVNAPRALQAVSIKSKIMVLERLKEKNEIN